jgi:hypothetical protein
LADPRNYIVVVTLINFHPNALYLARLDVVAVVFKARAITVKRLLIFSTRIDGFYYAAPRKRERAKPTTAHPMATPDSNRTLSRGLPGDCGRFSTVKGKTQRQALRHT